ncbi:MAG: hypothetical protein ACRDO7_12220 [Nocardioidaceae bacterium]
MTRQHEPGTVRWHIAADGSVIKSYPKALDHSNPQQDPPPGLKHLRYTTTRRLELSDLYALDQNLARSYVFFDRLSKVLLGPACAGVVGVVLGWLVLPWLGVSGAAVTALLAVSIVLVIVGVLGVVFVPATMRRRFDRIHVDRGFESSTPKVLKEPEAQAMLDAPGTVSGPSAGDVPPEESA